jgi:uncharacterized membrane protein
MNADPAGTGTVAAAARWLLAAFFVLAGLNHFRTPAIYLGMMPPALAWPAGLVAVSGVAEVAGGLGLLLPGTRRAAGWGLIALLVAVFPANLYVARLGHMPGLAFSARVLWLRLPFQAVLIAWVAWISLGRGPHGPVRSAPPSPGE